MTIIQEQTEFSLDYQPEPMKHIDPATPAEKRKIQGHAKTVKVPWSSIVIPNDNIRDADTTDLDALIASIRSIGLMQPPGVEPLGDPKDGKWILSFGFCRYLALAALGFSGDDETPVTFRKSGEHEYSRTLAMIAENQIRTDLNPIEEAEAISRLLRWHGMKAKDVAKAMQVSPNYITDRRRLLELPPKVRKQVATGIVAVDIGARIGRAIQAGAPEHILTKLVDNAADIGNNEMNAIEVRIKGAKEAETLRKRLEARGVRVVDSERSVPKDHTQVVRKVEALILNATAVRQLDLGKLETVRDADTDRPIVVIDTRFDGMAVAWTVRRSEKPPRETPANRPQRDWDAERTVQNKAMFDRFEWLRNATIGPATSTLLGAQVILQRLSKTAIAHVGNHVGLTPLRDEDGEVLERETIEDWTATASAKQLNAITTAAALASCRGYDNGVGHEPPAHFVTLIELGMPGPITEDEFTDAVTEARAMIDEIEGPDIDEEE